MEEHLRGFFKNKSIFVLSNTNYKSKDLTITTGKPFKDTADTVLYLYFLKTLSTL